MGLDVVCDDQVPETVCRAKVVCDLMERPMLTICGLREWKLEGLMRLMSGATSWSYSTFNIKVALEGSGYAV